MKRDHLIILTTGLLISILFFFQIRYFYWVKSLHQQQFPTFAHEVLYRLWEGLHFLSVDLKFQIRESANTDEIPVVLIAVDDESIRQVGRWPWSREQIAALVDQAFLSGVKTLGFDIVFSEPQSHPWETIIQRYNPPWKHELIHPDQKLEDIFARHGSKIVLGVFPENKRDKVLPYQDYCRNEAFLAHNASTFVKLDNFSFVVLDHDDPFESIPFQNLFQPIFKALSQAALDKLQSSKTGDHSDTKNDSTLQQLLLNYCEKWLTQEDPFLDISQNFFSSLQPPITIEQFKTQVKQYPIPQYDRWTINLERFHSQVLHSASFAAEQDSDGKIRRYPLFYRTGNRLGTSFVPSLALQTYLNAHPNWQAQIHIVPDEKRIEQKKIATMQIWDIHSNSQSHLIPTDPKGRLMINFYGPRYSFYYVPAYELLRHQPTMHVYRRSFSNKYDYLVESKMVEKQTFLKNKIAILGVTATAVYDLRVTPLDKTFPGPEIHVHALANLMENRYLTEPSQEEWLMPYLILFYGIIICCVFTFTGPIWNGITLIGCLLGIVGFDTYLFSQKGIVVTSIFPFVLTVSMFMIVTLYKYLTENKTKKLIRQTFSKYVSPSIVNEILSHPEKVELGGTKKNVTIFFSDLRGFTTISEKLDPKVLTDMLNRYLTPMTHVIFDNKGTLDKYMGDAIMAFFGAPVEYGDHPFYACQAALDSLKILKNLQEEFRKEGLPEIDMGIGINTAEVSVGNMGSQIIRNYTVMGDGVNLASRLEGATKQYGVRILISEKTYSYVRDHFLCRKVDRVRVKGKTEPIDIYQLLCRKTEQPPFIDLPLFEEAQKLFYATDFGQAKQLFQSFQQKNPEDKLVTLFIQKCEYFINHPPGPHWDGVTQLETK